MKKIALFLVVLAIAAAPLRAADETAPKKPAHKMAASGEKPVTLTPGDLQWGEVPPVLAAGAKLAVLDGDPGKAGNYTVRIQMPDGYKIMPHWHPTTERVTVISGEFHAGMGDKLDENGAMTFPPGGYAVMPARMHHFAFAKGETVVQVSGMGPFTLVYVNATDDPSGMQGKKKAAPKKAAAKAGN